METATGLDAFTPCRIIAGGTSKGPRLGFAGRSWDKLHIISNLVDHTPATICTTGPKYRLFSSALAGFQSMASFEITLKII